MIKVLNLKTKLETEIFRLTQYCLIKSTIKSHYFSKEMQRCIEGVMNKGIELCGIKLGDTLDENKFKVVKKESIPGGDYMSEIAKPSWMGRMRSTSTYFKNVNLVHSIGSKEISMIIADNGGGYSRKDCLDIINELNDYYLDKYGDHYDMYSEENDKGLCYFYYFYPPNHTVISFEDPKS